MFFVKNLRAVLAKCDGLFSYSKGSQKNAREDDDNIKT